MPAAGIKKANPLNKPISVAFTEEDYADLEEVAERVRRPMAWVVREGAIEYWLRKQTGEQA